MATRVVRHGDARFEKFFFSGMAILILVTVFLGFARTYYLAGVKDLSRPVTSPRTGNSVAIDRRGNYWLATPAGLVRFRPDLPPSSADRIIVIRPGSYGPTHKPRPKLFRGRHFRDDIILLCGRWYLRYSLSYRDLEELMAERGLSPVRPRSRLPGSIGDVRKWQPPPCFETWVRERRGP